MANRRERYPRHGQKIVCVLTGAIRRSIHTTIDRLAIPENNSKKSIARAR